jgi:hypothetical protein
MYVFTLGIFLIFEGIFGMLKSLCLPIKGGARARVKRFTTFEASTRFQILCLLVVTFVHLFLILVFEDSIRLFRPSNIGAHRVSAEKQLMMPPQKRSKKNTPTEIDQEEHHHVEDNGISHTLEPLHITDQEWREKLEALQKARDEKIAHTLEEYTQQDAHENDDDYDEAIDKELEEVQQKIQQLHKEKERFTNQLQVKRKASEKLEKLNQSKEQIERIQREFDEMKEQENSSLWQDSPHQDSGLNRRLTTAHCDQSSKEEKLSPDTISSIRLQERCYPLRPRTRTHKRWAVCTKVDTASGGKSTRSLGAESEHSPSPSRPTRRSSKRPDRIFPRQAFTSNQETRSRQNMSRKYAPKTHARTHQDLPHLSPTQNTIHNQATKVCIVGKWD